MSSANHADKKIDRVCCAIITVSDTRTEATDTSGALIRDLLEEAGHEVRSYEIIRDEPDLIRERVAALCADERVHAVLMSGGTGLARRDTTYEVLSSLCEKRLEGFGELFRLLSYEEVGAAAMLSRAFAGVIRETIVFSMPGSTPAVELAMQKLIIPQIGHIAALLRE